VECKKDQQKEEEKEEEVIPMRCCSYLITVWMLAMNQKICFVPRFRDSFVLRPHQMAARWTDGRTDDEQVL